MTVSRFRTRASIGRRSVIGHRVWTAEAGRSGATRMRRPDLTPRPSRRPPRLQYIISYTQNGGTIRSHFSRFPVGAAPLNPMVAGLIFDGLGWRNRDASNSSRRPRPRCPLAARRWRPPRRRSVRRPSV